jgi:hypothetical protein
MLLLPVNLATDTDTLFHDVATVHLVRTGIGSYTYEWGVVTNSGFAPLISEFTTKSYGGSPF